jgi:hypothetical protein
MKMLGPLKPFLSGCPAFLLLCPHCFVPDALSLDKDHEGVPGKKAYQDRRYLL